MTNQQTPIRCSNCGHQYAAPVRIYIDVANDPQAKAQILSGNLNTSQCPNCGMINRFATPILYHDAARELLVALVPMEINADKNLQERIIGDLMKQLPKENFKGYMFNPRRALTMQGLIDQILQADGVDPEEYRKSQERQREHIDLLQKMIEADTEEKLEDLIRQNDSMIDRSFFQTTAMMIQSTMANGHMEVAQQLMFLQNTLSNLSSFGRSQIEHQKQVIQEVGTAIQEMGAGATREAFFDLSLQYAESPEHLRALVRMARPAFDYQFFQDMTAKIGQLPASAREKAEKLRKDILEIIDAMDQQAQASAAAYLQAVVNHPDPEDALRSNISALDQNFIAILQANISNAEAQKNVQLSARLKQIESIIQKIMDEMKSATEFLRRLLGSDEPEAMLRENPEMIDDNLLTILSVNLQAAEENGDEEAAVTLARLYEIVVSILQENMKPELRFINDLLGADDIDQARSLLDAHASEYGNELIEIMDAVAGMLEAEGNPEILQRLKLLRSHAEQKLKA